MKREKMDYKFENSIKRAIALLNTPSDYQNYLILKLTLEPFSCHALHHWPNTWRQINEYIKPCGPLADEGDALIEEDGNKFVIESHESGPEIIVYLALATASVSLAKSIIDLVTTIIKGYSREIQKQSFRIKISKRQVIKGQFKENVIEVDIPLSKGTEKMLEEKIKKMLTQNP